MSDQNRLSSAYSVRSNSQTNYKETKNYEDQNPFQNYFSHIYV